MTSLTRAERLESRQVTYAAAKAAADLDVVAHVISLDANQVRRVREELVNWIARPGGSTWDCEAAGLRLRAGVSVPGWCTADYRGHLLAVRNDTRADSRAVLIRRLARVARMCHDNLAYTGNRAEVKYAARTHLCLVSNDQIGVAMRRENTWADVVERRADPATKWHLPRTLTCTLTPHAILHGPDTNTTCMKIGYTEDGLLHEAGSGPVAFGLSRLTEGVLVVTPPPDATTRQVSRCVADAVAAYRHLGRCDRCLHLSLFVAKFEDVTEENP